MKQTITRTVTSTIINHAIIHLNDDGEPQTTKVEPLIVSGKLDNDKAMKALKTHYYGEYDNFIIVSLETETEQYEMELNTFIQNATKIEKGDK